MNKLTNEQYENLLKIIGKILSPEQFEEYKKKVEEAETETNEQKQTYLFEK